MGAFYTVYNIRCTIPGGDAFTDTFEIYESEQSFLSYLYDYIEYAKVCMLDKNDQHFVDFPQEKEEYESYTSMIEQKLTNASFENGLYKKCFEALDITIEIHVATNDFKQFLDRIYEGLINRYDIWALEPDERKEIFEESPLLKYCAMVKLSGKIPREKTFIEKFNESEFEINEGACSLNI